jgi:hypothetical protein
VAAPATRPPAAKEDHQRRPPASTTTAAADLLHRRSPASNSVRRFALQRQPPYGGAHRNQPLTETP